MTRNYLFDWILITAHKQSCRKIMIWQVSVCHSVQKGSTYDHYPWSSNGTWVLLPKTPSTQLLTYGGHYWRPVQTCSLEDLPPPALVLTSSGGHHNIYSWQAVEYILLECCLVCFHWHLYLVPRLKKAPNKQSILRGTQWLTAESMGVTCNDKWLWYFITLQHTNNYVEHACHKSVLAKSPDLYWDVLVTTSVSASPPASDRLRLQLWTPPGSSAVCWPRTVNAAPSHPAYQNGI